MPFKVDFEQLEKQVFNELAINPNLLKFGNKKTAKEVQLSIKYGGSITDRYLNPKLLKGYKNEG